MVHDKAFTAQQEMQPRAAETPTFFSQFPQSATQFGVPIRLDWPPVCPTVHVHQLAGPPLGITMRLDGVTHGQAVFGGL